MTSILLSLTQADAGLREAIEMPPAAWIAMCRELAAAPAGPASTPTASGRPIRAYLLLNGWEGNPLIPAFDTRYPVSAAARQAVPDPHFHGREDEAPCVVPMPDELWHLTPGGSLAELLAYEWLAAWLQRAAQEARQRLVRQHFCGVVFSRASAREVARHLADLGHQTPPNEVQARLFHYQDPRVLQRTWPMLTPWQRKLWLGPVLQWWSLAQPWGPWHGVQDAASPDVSPAWFKAHPPLSSEFLRDDAQPSLRRLLLARQWEASRFSRAGHRIWQRYLDAGIGVEHQPNGALMTELLHAGLDLGLRGQNLEDFAWCSAHPRHLDAPGTRSIPWHSPNWAPVLQRVLNVLRDDSGATFGRVFHQLTSPTRKAPA